MYDDRPDGILSWMTDLMLKYPDYWIIGGAICGAIIGIQIAKGNNK